MAAVDLVEALRRELAPPPLDLSSLQEELAAVRRDLVRLISRDLAPPEVLIDLKEVCARTGWGRSSVLERLGLGTLPSPVDRGDTRLVWRASDIEAWIKSLPPRRQVGGADAG